MSTDNPYKSTPTQLKIFDALLALTRSKPLSQVTVTELCEAAQVSRMTFYRNYATKEEVLLRRFDELIAEYEKTTEELIAAGERWYNVGHICTCFAYFKEHRDFIDCLYSSGYAGYFINKVADYMLRKFWDQTRETRYIITGFAGVLCATYELWSREGFKETPQELAALVSKTYTPKQ